LVRGSAFAASKSPLRPSIFMSVGERPQTRGTATRTPRASRSATMGHVSTSLHAPSIGRYIEAAPVQDAKAGTERSCSSTAAD